MLIKKEFSHEAKSTKNTIKIKKLAVDVLLWKLLETRVLGVFKKIIDHNILLRRSGLRRTGKKMMGCSTNLHESIYCIFFNLKSVEDYYREMG